MASEARSADIFTPKQLREIADKKEMAEAHAAHERMKKAEDEIQEARREFMRREVRPDAMKRVMSAVKIAAEQGNSELMIVKFPSDLLKDGGRRINNFEPDWPDSLTGFARRAYDAYQANLQPLGYKLTAQILDFPGGMPGEVGLILRW